VPLASDEAYYWVWSRALAAGYPDHPPMVALWIRAGTWLVGEGPLGVRLLGPLAAALGSLALVQAGRDLLGSQRAGIAAAVMLNATLVFAAGSVMMTPDTPLLFFWAVALWALGRMEATGRPGWWLVAGAAIGAATASKYTGVLLAGSVAVWVLLMPTLRRRLASWPPYAGALLALAVFAPVIVWNADHNWVSFLRQGGRAADWAPARAAQFVGELIASQFGLATPVLAVLFGVGMVWAVRQAWRTRAPGPVLLALVTLLPAVVFLQHALGGRVEANWPAVIYPGVALAAAAATAWRWQAGGALLGVVLTAGVYLQAVFAPVPVPPTLDPFALRLVGWQDLAVAVAARAHREGAEFVAVDDYGLAAKLARDLPAALPVVGVEQRWSLFDLPSGRARIAGRVGLLLSPWPHGAPSPGGGWTEATTLGEIDRAGGALAGERYLLYRVVGADAGAPVAVLPRPQ
jgi:4-amino-4-deoxy-L-arabinose transferase-like glycosyltransferase